MTAPADDALLATRLGSTEDETTLIWPTTCGILRTGVNSEKLIPGRFGRAAWRVVY